MQCNNLFVECPAVGVAGTRPSELTDNVCLSGAKVSDDLERGFGFEARATPWVSITGNIVAKKAVGVGGANALTVDLRDNSGWHAGDPPVPLPSNPVVIIDGNIFFNWSGGLRVKMFGGSLTITDNVIADTGTGASVNLDVTTATVAASGNQYYNTASANQQMRLNGLLMSFGKWQSLTNDGSVFALEVYDDDEVTVESYNDDELGGAATLDDFMDGAKAMWRESWDTDYTAPR